MAKFHKNPIFFLHILIFFHQFDVLISQPTHSPILNCLNNQKITNFTLHPTSNHHSSLHYNHLLKFSLQNLRFASESTPKPTAIIIPDTKVQLINSVLCCRRSALDIRIRCGGHSYAAWVEGGATLGELYSAIADHSSYYGFPGGVTPTVGVSGHFSGGGIGVMGRKYGLSADNILDADLVDPDGYVLGRAEMGEEVFWALRGGGGGNWGVVYRWKVQLVHVPKKVTCFFVTKQAPINELAKLVYKWQFVAPYMDDSFHISIYLTASTSKDVYLTFLGFYLGSKLEAIKIIDRQFSELKIRQEEYLEMSWVESVLFLSGLPKGSTTRDFKSRYWSSKSYIKTKSDYVREPVSIEGLTGALEMVALEPRGLFLLDPYGGIMDQISSDSIAFPHRKGNIYNILYALLWGEGDDEDRCLSWINRFYDYMTPFVASNPRAAYVNYIDLDLGITDFANSNDNIVEKARAWGEKYFLGNYDRLVKAKTIIDPQNVFHHQQGIPPSNVKTHDEL
ncbi:berberine bridge enzyme-like D-2 isoform X2 [Beta vulgaris subsp. vulgaris]|uniref:berberine bridge enzyme-like D-2 isoform X2 n=1 Tax=Beta vulgaris subsp. vulgaris TaxID=3555 RepID=UPI0020372E90|nr:berberine bridge enzyme-like D-2 isoform X2 [Beta vulgaris subsp. vulgaris]